VQRARESVYSEFSSAATVPTPASSPSFPISEYAPASATDLPGKRLALAQWLATHRYLGHRDRVCRHGDLSGTLTAKIADDADSPVQIRWVLVLSGRGGVGS